MTKKKAGKGFSDWWLAEKRRCIFSARGVAKNVRVWSSKEKGDWKGLIGNWGANDCCQRKLFYLFILCSPDLRGGRSVLTRRLIIRFTCVICKHDGIIGRVNMDMWSVSWFYFILFIFNWNWCKSGYNTDSNCKSKKSKKSKRIAEYVWFKFLEMWKGIS